MIALLLYQQHRQLPSFFLRQNQWGRWGHGGPWWGHGELDQETVVPDAGELSSIDAEPSDEAMVWTTWVEICWHTVDGRHPAPVDRWFIVCWNQLYDFLWLSMSTPITNCLEPRIGRRLQMLKPAMGSLVQYRLPLTHLEWQPFWTRTDQPGTLKALPAFHWHVWFLKLSHLFILMYLI